MSRKFVIRSIAFVMLYVAAASYIFKNEADFFYSHETISQDFTYPLAHDFQELWIPLNQEMKLHGLWLKNSNKKAVVLYFPGSDYISGQINSSQDFYLAQGYDLIIPDYRNTGKSNGKYQTEEDIYQDANQWLKMAVSISDSLPLIIVGQDFGSGLAAYVSTQNKAQFLILEEPYYAWNDIMLRKYFWWLPHTNFTNFEIPLWKYVRASSQKTVLIHPVKSKHIKFKNSELLLEYLKPGDMLISLDQEKINYQSEEFLQKIEKAKLP